MNRAILAAASALFLAACQTTAEPQIVTKEVFVPVVKPCVPNDTPQKPLSYADDDLTSTTPPDLRYKAIATANQARKARLARIEPIIAGCR